eukprot:scaffold21737_cov114-Isochrysis_galbana.AAC.2
MSRAKAGAPEAASRCGVSPISVVSRRLMVVHSPRTSGSGSGRPKCRRRRRALTRGAMAPASEPTAARTVAAGPDAVAAPSAPTRRRSEAAARAAAAGAALLRTRPASAAASASRPSSSSARARQRSASGFVGRSTSAIDASWCASDARPSCRRAAERHM